MSLKPALIVFLTSSLLLIPQASSTLNDLTLESQTKGYDVALAVVRKIYRSDIFEDDFFFVHRVALVATKFGDDPKTYDEDNLYRGIWQLSESQFNETLVNPNITEVRNKIGEKLPEIGDWNSSVTWEDLLKPLYNGLAFRLYVETLIERTYVNPYFNYIPSKLVDQGVFYQTNFNSSVDTEQFLNTVLSFEENPKCNAEMDIVFVQDVSCTVIEANFTDTLNFFNGVIKTLEFSNIRVGHVVYSSEIVSEFGLTNKFTEEELQIQILNATRPVAQYTMTASGLSQALKMFEVASSRIGVPKIIFSTTDGQAIEYFDEVTNQTIEAGVTTFATTTGYSWSQDQLLATALYQPGNVLKNGFSFNLIPEFIYRSNLGLCSVPATLESGVVSKGIVGLYEKRNYKFNFLEAGSAGLNFTIGLQLGEIRVFYSYGEETPTFAINDGDIQSGISTLLPQDNASYKIYIAVEGLGEENIYDISAILV